MALLSPHQHQRLEKTLAQVAETALAETPYVLIATKVEEAFGQLAVQFFVDLPWGQPRIGLEECAKVSALLDGPVEALAELQAPRYQLEVSSPGLFRFLSTEREWPFYAEGQATVGLRALEGGDGQPLPLSADAAAFLQAHPKLKEATLLQASGTLLTLGIHGEGGLSAHTHTLDMATLPAGVGLQLQPQIQWPSDEASDENGDALTLDDADDADTSEG